SPVSVWIIHDSLAEIAAWPKPSACVGFGSVPTWVYGGIYPFCTSENNHFRLFCTRGSSKLYSVPHTSALVCRHPMEPASQDHWVCPSTAPDPMEASPETAPWTGSN